MISENLDTWQGKPVVDWTPEATAPLQGDIAYRLRVEWEAEETWIDLFAQFLALPDADKVTTLIVGAWGELQEGSDDSEQVVRALAGARHQLPRLNALFFGDITYEECEISWIAQSDLSPLLTAYPELEHLTARGAQGLSLGVPRHHHLKSLTIEAGGLPVSVIEEVSRATLPTLEHLELYLGSANYGGDSTVESLHTILHEGHEKWPHLTYLGLRDCEYTDELAAALAENGGVPILRQLQTLDLSLGTLGDAGVKALAACPAVAHLKQLDMHHHFASEESVALLTALGIEVDFDDPQNEDDDRRYVAVSE